MAIAVLLTFSRAAWGQFALTTALLMFLTFVTTRSGNARLRIVLIAITGAIVLVLMLAALLSIDRVAELFKERAALEQSYDAGHLGRFGRHLLGFRARARPAVRHRPAAVQQALPRGPAQHLPERVPVRRLALRHGLRDAGADHAARSGCAPCSSTRRGGTTYLAVYCAFVGAAAESVLIDSDHWRHYFLLLGVIWGLMAASRPYARRRLAPRHDAVPRRPCTARPPGVVVCPKSERSAARLAHQSGGLGVPSSNLGAPTINSLAGNAFGRLSCSGASMSPSGRESTGLATNPGISATWLAAPIAAAAAFYLWNFVDLFPLIEYREWIDGAGLEGACISSTTMRSATR